MPKIDHAWQFTFHDLDRIAYTLITYVSIFCRTPTDGSAWLGKSALCIQSGHS